MPAVLGDGLPTCGSCFGGIVRGLIGRTGGQNKHRRKCRDRQAQGNENDAYLPLLKARNLKALYAKR